MRKLLALISLVFLTATRLLAQTCTATEQNAFYGNDNAATNTATVTANVNAVGDFVAFTAWCFRGCTPVSVTMGGQTATQTTVSGVVDNSNPGSGQGFIFYILSAAASGSQTVTWTVSGSHSGIQVSYIDFKPSAGCKFTHNVDSPLGSCLSGPCLGSTGAPAIVKLPSITPTAGDVLFNFTWSSEHVNDILSPWSCPIYAGGTGDCQFAGTRNVAAYILSAASGSTANNTTTTHDSDTWQALLTSFTLSPSANSCPTGANYLNASGSLVTLASLGVTTCWYVSAAGLDTNNGNTELTPWKLSPGMNNYAGGHTLAPGDGIIFRGGDTWHFGNSGLSPYGGVKTNCQINATQSAGLCLASKHGTSSNPIYFGVDPTWFSGGSWARPILTGDNPLTPNPGIANDSVASCGFQIGTNNTIASFESASWLVFDNFELTGLCSQTLGGNGGDVYMEEEGATNDIYEHVYMHGWTHIPFTCGGSPGYCFNLRAIHGNTTGIEHHIQTVLDGLDSDPAGLGSIFNGGYDVSQSVFRYTAQGIPQGTHTWHDNLIEHWFGPGDGFAHGNLWEENGEAVGTNAVYNNIFRHVCTDGVTCPGDVGFWPKPPVGTTQYWFNNLVYDVDASYIGNYFNIGQNSNSGAQGTLVIFNNLFQLSGNGALLDCASTFSHPFTAANNHYVTEASSQYSSPCSFSTFVTDSLRMTNAAATAAGYTQAETFAYSPPAANSATVGGGTNEQSFCTALSTAGLAAAATACQSDTTFGVTYNASNHTAVPSTRMLVARPASTAWNLGPYQFVAGTGVNQNGACNETQTTTPNVTVQATHGISVTENQTTVPMVIANRSVPNGAICHAIP